MVTPSGRDSSSTRTACLEPIRQGLTGSPVGLRSVPRRARGFGSPFAFACFAAGLAAASCCFYLLPYPFPVSLSFLTNFPTNYPDRPDRANSGWGFGPDRHPDRHPDRPDRNPDR